MARRKQSALGDISTRDRILNSAKKYFLECGFQAAPLRKIATDAGFTSGALYGYFDSKEDLFYSITDPVAEKLMKKLNEVGKEIDEIPDKNRLSSMGSVYYHHIPEIVEILLSDRDAVKLIVTCSKGTKYERFVESIASRNTVNIENAATKSGEDNIEVIQEETLSILMEEYITTLFRLVTSDRDKKTIINCMELIGRVYETGITNLMKKEK